jgi:hypothetical protein
MEAEPMVEAGSGTQIEVAQDNKTVETKLIELGATKKNKNQRMKHIKIKNTKGSIDENNKNKIEGEAKAGTDASQAFWYFRPEIHPKISHRLEVNARNPDNLSTIPHYEKSVIQVRIPIAPRIGTLVLNPIRQSGLQKNPALILINYYQTSLPSQDIAI